MELGFVGSVCHTFQPNHEQGGHVGDIAEKVVGGPGNYITCGSGLSSHLCIMGPVWSWSLMGTAQIQHESGNPKEKSHDVGLEGHPM